MKQANAMTMPEQSGALTRARMRYRDWLARDGLNPWTAEFRNREQEKQFRRHLVDHQLPKERMIDFSGVVLYFLYGFLDILTITHNLNVLLILRWVLVVPVAAVLVSLLYVDRFKPYFGYITAMVMALFANLIVVMIVMMQNVDAPPYLIGVFFVFVFCSCVQRIPFRVALAVFTFTAINYTTLVSFDAGIREADRVSGIAFMISFSVIAAATNYLRELEARMLWRRDEQKRLDAIHIEELLIEATAADRSKNNFLSILSHELRTPLHQIIGFSGLLKTEIANPKPDEAAEFLDQIHDSAHDLLSRISKMLRYADATAGKIEYDFDKCDIRDLVDTLAFDLQSRANEAKVNIDFSRVAKATLRLDPVHSKYALNNLVENAIDASPEGSTISLVGNVHDDGSYLLEIVDDGCGISQNQIEAAFRPFSQTADAHTRLKEGIGLGLPLSKKIFSDQNAELSIKPNTSKGTTVNVLFAADKIQTAA